MHRTVRMLAILLELQRDATTIGKLAETYECSRKTIQRDIAALVELNIPVRSSSGVTGGISLDPTWTLAPMNLTSDEIETTILALENATHLPAAEQTMAKIRAAARPSHFDAVASHPQRPLNRRALAAGMPDGVGQLRKVMSRQMWCRIDYSGGSNPGWRLVLPHELHISEGRWYLQAIDERSHEHRVFRVDRMRDIAPALAPPEAAEIIAWALSMPEYHSDIYPEIIVELSPGAVQFCRDHSHFHQAIAGDQLRFRCPPNEYAYVAREIVRMGTECRILAPPELIDAARELVSRIGTHINLNTDITAS